MTDSLAQLLQPHQAWFIARPTHITYLTNFVMLLPEDREAFVVVTPQTTYLLHASFSPTPSSDTLVKKEGVSPRKIVDHLSAIAKQEGLTELLVDTLAVWDDVTYDEVTGLVYLSAGGTSPWNPTERGVNRGDELFTNSIIALDAKTGRYVWHYQVTPRDGWNLEPVGPKILADIQIDGRQRRVVMDAPKNGFFYVLDARTGPDQQTGRLRAGELGERNRCRHRASRA